MFSVTHTLDNELINGNIGKINTSNHNYVHSKGKNVIKFNNKVEIKFLKIKSLKEYISSYGTKHDKIYKEQYTLKTMKILLIYIDTITNLI